MKFGLIFSNDIMENDRSIQVSKEVAPYFDGIKLGMASVLGKGLELIKETKRVTDKMIIADFKVADIGFWSLNKNSWEGTNAKIVEQAVNAGADYIICHSIVGVSSIQECLDIAHSMGSKILTLPYMTHKGAELFFSHPINLDHIAEVFENMGINISEDKLRTCKTVTDSILALGHSLNVDGFIGPANKFEVLRRYRKFTDKGIFGPGIGRQVLGNLTPKTQLEKFYETCGRNSAAIIGSAIYKAEDPVEAAKEFKKWRNEVVPE